MSPKEKAMRYVEKETGIERECGDPLFDIISEAIDIALQTK